MALSSGKPSEKKDIRKSLSNVSVGAWMSKFDAACGQPLTRWANSQHLARSADFSTSVHLRGLTFIQDRLVSKDNDLKLAITLEASQDLSTGATAGFDVKSANSNTAK